MGQKNCSSSDSISFGQFRSVGVYWVNSNLDLVMGLLASEAPERLSISTYPNDMQVVINNKPVKDRSPLIYNFQTHYPDKHKLPVRFMWKRKNPQ